MRRSDSVLGCSGGQSSGGEDTTPTVGAGGGVFGASIIGVRPDRPMSGEASIVVSSGHHHGLNELNQS